MSDGKLNRVLARELAQRQKASLFLAALLIAIAIVVLAVAVSFALR